MKCQNTHLNPYPKRLQGQEGVTTLETALLMAPFLLLLFGVLELGLFFLHQHTLQYAVREGARAAMVGKIHDETINGETRPMSLLDSIKEEVVKKAEAVMTIKKENVTPDVLNADEDGNAGEDEKWKDPTSFGDSTSPGNAGNAARYMRLQATYQHHFLTPYLGHLLGDCSTDGCSITLNAKTTYRNE